jgi:hypothetical protein
MAQVVKANYVKPILAGLIRGGWNRTFAIFDENYSLNTNKLYLRPVIWTLFDRGYSVSEVVDLMNDWLNEQGFGVRYEDSVFIFSPLSKGTVLPSVLDISSADHWLVREGDDIVKAKQIQLIKALHQEVNKRIRIRRKDLFTSGNWQYAQTMAGDAVHMIESLQEGGWLSPEKRFADLGSGDGIVIHLAQCITGCFATGIEREEDLINEARRTSRVLSRNNTDEYNGSTASRMWVNGTYQNLMYYLYTHPMTGTVSSWTLSRSSRA